MTDDPLTERARDGRAGRSASSTPSRSTSRARASTTPTTAPRRRNRELESSAKDGADKHDAKMADKQAEKKKDKKADAKPAARSRPARPARAVATEPRPPSSARERRQRVGARRGDVVRRRDVEGAFVDRTAQEVRRGRSGRSGSRAALDRRGRAPPSMRPRP